MGTTVQAYCFKCRAKREMKHPQRVSLKNGRPATRGVCPVCGSKIFRIGEGARRVEIRRPPPGPDFEIPKKE